MVPNPHDDQTCANPVQTEVGYVLYKSNNDGTCVAQAAREKTLRDLGLYVQHNRDTPDDIVKYGLYLQAVLVYHASMQSQDSQDSATKSLTAIVKLMDPEKIEKGLQEYTSKPEVQRWLADAQKCNLDQCVEEAIRHGGLPDLPVGARTGQYMDALLARQDEHFFSDEQIAAVVRLAIEQRQYYHLTAAKAYAEMGLTPQEIEARIARHQVRVLAHVPHTGWGSWLRA